MSMRVIFLGLALALALSPALSQEATTARKACLGLHVRPVPFELATHLGIESAGAVLVEEVDEGSRAAEAGIEPLDVILPSEERGAALRVVRGGVERRAVIPVAVGALSEPAFVSAETVGPDHPFRQIEAYRALRDSYAAKAEAYAKLAREADQRSREAREEARKAAEELLRRCEAQAEEVLAAREKALLEIVEAGLRPERAERLQALALDFEALLPAERTAAVAERARAIAVSLQTSAAERLPSGDESSEIASRRRQEFARIGQEASRLFESRMERPWASALQHAMQHRDRVGPQFRGRLEWTASAVGQIRDRVRDRLACAVRRAREELSRDLATRLRRMEVPKTGEIEGCLEDVGAQLDDMAHRFVRRTEAALAAFEAETGRANRDLLSRAEPGLAASERAFAEFEADVAALLEERVPKAALGENPSWRASGAADDVAHALRGELLSRVNAGRDAVRGGALGVEGAFRDHRVGADDAWEDLQRLLREIQQMAANSCWKLDGPHLDGRFPESEGAKPRKGDIAFLDR